MEALLCEGTAPLSRLIRLFTGSHSTHWAGRFGGGEELWCVHSTIGGVQPEWWWALKKKYPKLRRFRARFDCADDALTAAAERLGHRRYDYGGLFGKAYYLAATRLGFSPKKNPFGNKHRYDCVEFGNEFHREVHKRQPELGIRIWDGGFLDPGDMTDYYASTPELFEEIHEAI